MSNLTYAPAAWQKLRFGEQVVLTPVRFVVKDQRIEEYIYTHGQERRGTAYVAQPQGTLLTTEAVLRECVRTGVLYQLLLSCPDRLKKLAAVNQQRLTILAQFVKFLEKSSFAKTAPDLIKSLVSQMQTIERYAQREYFYTADTLFKNLNAVIQSKELKATDASVMFGGYQLLVNTVHGRRNAQSLLADMHIAIELKLDLLSSHAEQRAVLETTNDVFNQLRALDDVERNPRVGLPDMTGDAIAQGVQGKVRDMLARTLERMS
jgi:hypothetical protein